jgi:hypothetical protein
MRVWLLGICLLGAVSQQVAQAQEVHEVQKGQKGQVSVQVRLNSQQPFEKVFITRPWLDELLAVVPDPDNVYWPAAALYALGNAEPEAERDALMRQLQALQQAQAHQDEVYLALSALSEQLQNWMLHKRVSLVLDYDRVRIHPNTNLKVDQGEYLLIAGQRPDSILVCGAVVQEQRIRHLGMAPVHHYLSHIQRLPAADPGWVYVIQPEGIWQKVPVGLWNRGDHTLRPGSILYVPIHPRKLPSRDRPINERLVRLLQHRVVQP